MKTNLFVLVFFLIGLSAFSQTYIGVKASMHASSLTSRESQGNIGYSVGGFMDIPIAHTWALSPSVLFSLNQPHGEKNYKTDFLFQAYSLEVPLLLSYRIGEEAMVMALDFGPYFRYGLFGNSWLKDEKGVKEKFDTFDEVRRFNFGPMGGLRMIMNEINIGFSLQYGLLRPSDLRRGNDFTFNLTFGYSFEL